VVAEEIAARLLELSDRPRKTAGNRRSRGMKKSLSAGAVLRRFKNVNGDSHQLRYAGDGLAGNLHALGSPGRGQRRRASRSGPTTTRNLWSSSVAAAGANAAATAMFTRVPIARLIQSFFPNLSIACTTYTRVFGWPCHRRAHCVYRNGARSERERRAFAH
jgi:hypothetical protein